MPGKIFKLVNVFNVDPSKKNSGFVTDATNNCSAGEIREDEYGHYSVAEAQSIDIDGSEQKGLIFARGRFVEKK